MTDELLKQKVASAIRESGITELYHELIRTTNATTRAHNREYATRLRSRELDAAIARFEALDSGGIVH